MTFPHLFTYTIIAGLFGFIIAFPIISLLYKFKLVRNIDVDYSTLISKRRLKQGTPIMGGLIVVITVIFVNLVFNLNGASKIPLVVFSISSMLGAFDDIFNIYGRVRPVRSVRHVTKLIFVHANKLTRLKYLMSLPWLIYKRIFFLLGSNPGKGIQAHEKIIVQSIAGGFLAWWLWRGTGWVTPGAIWFPFLHSLNIGWLIIPLAIFTVVAMTNAVNITDGMDGMAGGTLAIAFSAFTVIAFLQNEFSIAIICAVTVGALISYLYFNIPPARFQMGDVGSLALGALLATVAFALNKVFLLPIIGLIFVAEISSTLIQGLARRVIGRRLFKMAPLHHHFEMSGWSEEKVVMRFCLFAAALGVLGIWLSQF